MNRHKNNNLSVGVIGKDNHALRLIKILEKSDLVEDIKIYYHRDYKGIDPRVTNDLQTLFSCNAIIIASYGTFSTGINIKLKVFVKSQSRSKAED